jgi:putative colanic acid biosynthesis acetyltransferase WcaF
VISPKAFLCTGSHDPDDPNMTLTTGPIVVDDGAWIAADVFVAPNVRIGAETVVGARSSVFGSLPPGAVCYGSPCVMVRERRLGQRRDEADG